MVGIAGITLIALGVVLISVGNRHNCQASQQVHCMTAVCLFNWMTN